MPSPPVDGVRSLPGVEPGTLHVQVTQRKPLARVHTSQAPKRQTFTWTAEGTRTATVTLLHGPGARHPRDACGDAAAEAFERWSKPPTNDPLWSAFIDQSGGQSHRTVSMWTSVPGLERRANALWRSPEHLEDNKLNKLHVYSTREHVARGNLNVYKRIDLTLRKIKWSLNGITKHPLTSMDSAIKHPRRTNRGRPRHRDDENRLLRRAPQRTR